MNFEVISRRLAADTGQTFYYTGVPCKHGHLTQRYTTNGGCKACINGNYKPRLNSFTGELTGFYPSKLWAPKSFTRDDLICLRFYLQTCVYAYTASIGKMTVELETARYEHEIRTPQTENPNEVP